MHEAHDQTVQQPHVEILDVSGKDGVVVPSKVLINGIDVGLLAEAPRISAGESTSADVVKLTLVLLPASLYIGSPRQ